MPLSSLEVSNEDNPLLMHQVPTLALGELPSSIMRAEQKDKCPGTRVILIGQNLYYNYPESDGQWVMRPMLWREYYESGGGDWIDRATGQVISSAQFAPKRDGERSPSQIPPRNSEISRRVFKPDSEHTKSGPFSVANNVDPVPHFPAFDELPILHVVEDGRGYCIPVIFCPARKYDGNTFSSCWHTGLELPVDAAIDQWRNQQADWEEERGNPDHSNEDSKCQHLSFFRSGVWFYPVCEVSQMYSQQNKAAICNRISGHLIRHRKESGNGFKRGISGKSRDDALEALRCLLLGIPVEIVVVRVQKPDRNPWTYPLNLTSPTDDHGTVDPNVSSCVASKAKSFVAARVSYVPIPWQQSVVSGDMKPTPTPRTIPTRLSAVTASHPLPSIPSLPPAAAWIPILSTPTSCSITSFFAACESFVLHPEYNSSTILRCDVLLDSKDAVDVGEEAEEGEYDKLGWDGYAKLRRVRRKLVPKRKQFDAEMEEDCIFLSRESTGEEVGEGREGEGVVVLLPDLKALDSKGSLPYYHPDVSALAFRYLSGVLRVDLVPLPHQSLPDPLPDSHRLYRTTLALLNQLSSVAKGLDEGYEKRVIHDLLVDRNAVQDLYRGLKEKYLADLTPHDPRITFRWLMKEWKESTDPAKHLFEDVAIAAWLILLWRDMYGEDEDRKGPPGGFVDVGCGNGLLVYILSQEGYKGYGVDLRARKTWSLFPSSTTDLRVQSLNPINIINSPTPIFPPGSFLIGNHADELTPWMPLFSAVTPHSSYLSIPCCCFELATNFTRTSYAIPDDFLSSLPTPGTSSKSTLLEPFYAPTPSETTQGGRYFAYQLYLAHLSLLCGFIPEREALRMPSTKNFGIVGRKRIWENAAVSHEDPKDRGDTVLEKVRELADSVAGQWVARTPEGKDH